MEKADRCRRAAVEAVADVEPPALSDYIETVLDESSMVPGSLALESAATFLPDATSAIEREDGDGRGSASPHTSSVETDGRSPLETDGVVSQSAGVQLIYEGLRLTRSLAREEPWAVTDGVAETHDLEILAADILVARGFYLLARTEAADKAVRTVQAFGHDQTRRADLAAEHDDSADLVAVDASLERDVLELAVLTGATAVGESPTPRLLSIAEALAADVGTSFPPAAECLDGLEAAPSERLPDDPPNDPATSATDS